MNKYINKYKNILLTLPKLGYKNLIFIFIYKIKKKSNIYKRLSPLKKCPSPGKIDLKKIDHLFPDTKSNLKYVEEANKLINREITFFVAHKFKIRSSPDWFYNPFNKKYFENGGKIHWSKYDVFGKGDIKICWDLSRWGWAIIFAKAYKVTKKKKYIDAYNSWIESWINKNTLNSGPNWICGQESSIRLLQAIISWQILDYPSNIPIITEERKLFIEVHLERIYLTRIYAEAQQNNHWITESAALFIGGGLIKNKKYTSYGRKALEKSMQKLVMEDGTFSQYSVNYHRLLLDTINQVEIWRRKLYLHQFSQKFYLKCQKAAEWMSCFIDPESGDAPNIGGNDGTYCFQFNDFNYRDYRSSLYLSSYLFNLKFGILDNYNNDEIFWLQIPKVISKGVKRFEKDCFFYRNFQAGGFVVIRNNKDTWAILRLPKYKFRPSNSDPLHFDFWNKGKNLISDGGSYSYNVDSKNLNYFQGIRSHNSVEFDNSEPMPMISRFLFANWVQEFGDTLILEKPNEFLFSSSYRCALGEHQREILVSNDSKRWEITDKVKGFKKHAIIRWNLYGNNWSLNKNKLYGESVSIDIISESNNYKLTLENGWSSKKYLMKERVTTLKVKVEANPSTVKTIIKV